MIPASLADGVVGLVAFDLNELWVLEVDSGLERAMMGSPERPTLARARGLGSRVVIEEDSSIPGRRIWMVDSLRPGVVQEEASGWIEADVEVVRSGMDVDGDEVRELAINDGALLYGLESLGPDGDLPSAGWSFPGQWVAGSGDFDGDGHSEVVVLSEVGGDSVVVGLAGERARLVGGGPALPYDFDLDGVLDLVSEREGVVGWWKGLVQGTRQFEDLPVLWRFEDNDALRLDVLGDVDGDGAPDLMCSPLEGGRHWLRGSTAGERWLVSDTTFWESGVGGEGRLVLVGNAFGQDAPIFILTAGDIW